MKAPGGRGVQKSTTSSAAKRVRPRPAASTVESDETSNALPLKAQRIESQGVVAAPSSLAEVSSAVADAASTSSTTVVELTPEEYLAKIQSRVKQSSKLGSGLVDTKLLATDAVYRIIHHTHRSDAIEIVKCQFGSAECQRAMSYFEKEYSRAPVRRLRLQMHVPMTQGLDVMLPFLALQRSSLRLVDLSRNKLTADDVLTLSDALKLSENGPLEVLDLSYNRGIGDTGATQLMSALRSNATIRAVILKSVSVTDAGAEMLAAYVKSRPIPEAMTAAPSQVGVGAVEEEHEGREGEPLTDDGGVDQPVRRLTKAGKPDHAAAGFLSTSYQFLHSGGKVNFFLNLNENRIGARGIMAIRRDLPEHVSLTVVKQNIPQQKRGGSQGDTLASAVGRKPSL